MVDLNNPMIKFIGEMIILSATGIIMTVTVLLRKRIAEKAIRWVEKTFKLKVYASNGHIDKQSLERDKAINHILSELRLKTKADRAQVFQFHNGNMFTSKNQMWKLSCTHEIVDTVASTQENLQNILSSCVTDILYPFWDNGDLSEYPGVIRVSPRVCKCPNIETCTVPCGVYFYRISGLKPGYSRGLLSDHKVFYMLQTPLIDPTDNIIGFVVLDYCWEEAPVAEIEGFAEELCKIASTISYKLNIPGA
jgi:hypothetical protein